MSTSSTQSFFSMSRRMRVSAEIGSANSTRSTRVRRANSTMSSTLPSFGAGTAQVSSARLSLRSSNTPSTAISVPVLGLQGLRPAFRRSGRSRRSRCSGRGDCSPWMRPSYGPRCRAKHARSPIKAGGADEEECGEPQPGNLAAELGEERSADKEQKTNAQDERGSSASSGRAAAGTHRLRTSRRPESRSPRPSLSRRSGRHYSQWKPAKPRHAAEIDPNPDRAEQHEIGDAHAASDHDRRIGGADLLAGDGKRGLR